jgi:putative transposon-encoded protein
MKIIIEFDEKKDELIKKECKKFGGYAGHIIVPAEHIGKTAFVIFSDNIEVKQ